MAQTATKIEYPTGQDPFQPHRDIKQLAESASGVIVPVANRAEGDAIADALNPTRNNPLYVDRADTGQMERNDGQGWQLIGLGQEETYTPQLTATETNPNLGSTGKAAGLWVRVGRMVNVWGVFEAGGSSMSSGSGYLRVSLPVPALESFYNVSPNLGSGPPIGHGRLRISGSSSNVRNLYAQINSYDGLVFFGIDQRVSALNADDLSGNYSLSFAFSYYSEPIGGATL